MSEPPAVDALTAWDTRRAATPEPVPDPAPVDGRPAYGEAILDGELDRVRAAVEGTRNDTLNVAAVKIGRAVAGGHVDGDVAVARLITAATEVGLSRRESIATIRSGMRYGQRYPRDPEAANQDQKPRGLRHSDETPRVPAPTDVTDRLPAGPTPAARAPDAPPRLDVTGYLRPATWLLDRPADPPPIWGEPGAPLWAAGQSLMLAALPGLGKSTIAVQLVRARLGLDPRVLDAPVTEGKRVLYLCMDRPEQIAGLLMRAIDRDELADVGDRLVLGWGPPPADVARHPELLAELAATAQADTLVIDSLKDAAIKLTDDEIGAAYNRARQTAVTAGVEVLELHHLVKRNADGKPPSSLADVYGSAHLTSGAGSVLVLVGESGDPIVRALHLKPLREPWGPAWLTHDHEAGRTAVLNRVDPLERLARSGVETAESLARALFETDKPSRAQTEKARRHLDRLVRAGLAYVEPGRAGGGEDRSPTRYHPHTRPPTPWEAHEERTTDDDQPEPEPVEAQPTMEG